MKNFSIIISFLLVALLPLKVLNAQSLERMDPPNWWKGMENPEVQVLLKGNQIADYQLAVNDMSVLKEVIRVPNRNYLFVNLQIPETYEPNQLIFTLKHDKKKTISATFPLLKRDKESEGKAGFSSKDVVYLLMPDRFANGDWENDEIPAMREQTNREEPDGRHGGDLEGIRARLDYFTNLGVSALWLNPVLENNMPAYSYHGYAITDHYAVDSHLGTLNEYKQLVDEAHQKDLKIIMDMVLNHCGSYHWWMDDLPTDDWVHQFPEYTPSNYRNMVKTDPYASDYDTRIMGTGWFDRTMPDLNQKQPLLSNYLIQNSIWWIETTGIDGIRLDTQPYSSKEMVSQWAKRIRTEYPDFTIVGEAWVQRTAPTAYWQENTNPMAEYNSHIQVVTDFPMHFAIAKAFNEPTTWTEGLARLYYILAQDFLYPNAMNTLTFADNHDLSRIYTLLGEDIDKLKMAMGFLLTTRGIPMIYSGTEILQTGFEHHGHGEMRKDFPGGWPNDEVNYFDPQQRKGEVKAFHDYLTRLLNWRRDARVIHEGALTQFIPNGEQYVYFRHSAEACVMVVLNNDSKTTVLETSRFKECLKGFEQGFDIVNGEKLTQLQNIELAPKSIRIIELKP